MSWLQTCRDGCVALLLAGTGLAAAWGQSAAPGLGPQQLQTLAAEEAPRVLDSLRALVEIESGSRDLEGLDRIATLISQRLGAAGLQVQRLPARAPAFHPQLRGAELGPMVYATRRGTGQRKVLLIAHMDTVYPRGMGARQPFRLDGNRAYGLGIADAKGGVALILHTVELLQRLGVEDYAQLGVLINGDEEVGSPGSGPFLTQLGSDYDAVLSFEHGGFVHDQLRLATSSIAIVELTITGRASHAGANPQAGRNALYELAHQVLKTRDFSEPDRGLKINWTVADAGSARNVIPATATAIADVRALNNEDLDRLEGRLRAAIQESLIPDTRAELSFYRSRPALSATARSQALARHAQGIFQSLGLRLDVLSKATGGGTDAAFAGLRPKGGVVEGFGLRGYGAHSSDDEFIYVDSIAPRLSLALRMVMDVGRGLPVW